jgi:pimeloyl-ACP methyl ester carboxylesterase
MVMERRKPVLGRVVPGVTPDTQRRLRAFFALAQGLSNSLAARLALLLFCTPPRRKLEPADAPILERAQRSILRCGKDRFTIFRWEHAGPPVVLLHGWGSHAARFADFVAPLQAAGFSVIGHSLGGGAVLTVLAETADHHPKKICLFGVPSDMDYILESFAMMLGLKPPALARLRALFLARFGRPASAISVAAAAPKVRIPVLVVHDEDDNVAPMTQGAAMAESIPGAILWRTRGFGHSGALRDPATIRRVIDFLRS